MAVISGGHAAEQHLPENLRVLRERKGMSQASLAQAMSERGWPWHQQTVYKIENGKQGVGFGEAADLAGIFGVTTDRFTWTGPETLAATLLANAAGTLRQSWREAADAVARLHAARATAGRLIAEHRDSSYPRVRDAARGLADELGDTALEGALAEGGDLWQRTAAGAA